MDDVLLADSTLLVMEHYDTPQDELVEHACEDVGMDIHQEPVVLGGLDHGDQA